MYVVSGLLRFSAVTIMQFKGLSDNILLFTFTACPVIKVREGSVQKRGVEINEIIRNGQTRSIGPICLYEEGQRIPVL